MLAAQHDDDRKLPPLYNIPEIIVQREIAGL